MKKVRANCYNGRTSKAFHLGSFTPSRPCVTKLASTKIKVDFYDYIAPARYDMPRLSGVTRLLLGFKRLLPNIKCLLLIVKLPIFFYFYFNRPIFCPLRSIGHADPCFIVAYGQEGRGTVE